MRELETGLGASVVVSATHDTLQHGCGLQDCVSGHSSAMHLTDEQRVPARHLKNPFRSLVVGRSLQPT